MEYRYEGTGDLEGLILESALPKELWGFGTEVLIYSNQPERLNPETPIPEWGANAPLNYDEWQRRCDSLNTTNK